MQLLFKLKRVVVGFLFLSVLAACAVPPDAERTVEGVYDPYENANRNVHQFNKGLDRAVIRPVGRAYTTVLPDEVEDSVGNFASNLGEPANVVNSLLQGRLRNAGISTSRFLINTTLGLGGLFDAASDFGVPEADTDFGETLHVWGAGEGAYIELPVLGPSTQRDAVGIVVDLFTDPLGATLEAPEENYRLAATLASRVGDRGRFSEIVDSILYDSADSYAQGRLIYLQNRRFELGQDDFSTAADPFALDTEGF